MERLNESIYSMYQRWNSGENGQRKEDVHEYVDLGLPSGLLWATCNLGANSLLDVGDYYRWGSIKPEYESGITPRYYNVDDEYTKYNDEDKLTTLEPNDDAVHVAWGGNWRMPTEEECQELIDNCEQREVENYKDSGVKGYLFKSKHNNNELFFPYGGWGITISKIMFKEIMFEIWSSTLSDYDYKEAIYIGTSYAKNPTQRYVLMNIRGVKTK